MTRFLRFVKSAHFFAIAIACVFGVLATTNSFAACGSNQYTGPNGNCVACPSGTYQDVATSAPGCMVNPRQCGSGTFNCPYNAFKVYNSNSGTYGCHVCPSVYDGGTYGWNGSVTWATNAVCKFTTTGTMTDTSTNCLYKKTIKVNDSSTWPVDSVPNTATTDLNCYAATGSGNGTAFTKWITYTSCPAGYGATNNGTASASSAKCASGKYSPAGSVTCTQTPNGSTTNSDQSGFVCNKNWYKHGSSCYKCPLYIPIEATESYVSTDPTNWPVTVTAAAGAESVEECYSELTDSDDYGTFNTGVCTMNLCSGATGCSVDAIGVLYHCMGDNEVYNAMWNICGAWGETYGQQNCAQQLAASCERYSNGLIYCEYNVNDLSYFTPNSPYVNWPANLRTMLNTMRQTDYCNSYGVTYIWYD